MAKFAIVLILAVAALQSSFATPVHRDAWDIFQYLQFLSLKLEETAKSVTTDLPEEIKTFSDKINFIFSTHNIQNDIGTFKHDLRELYKNSVDCNNDVELKMDNVVESTLKEINSCENAIQSVADSMDQKFKSIVAKAGELLNLLTMAELQCSEDHLGSYQDTKQCLEDFIFGFVEKVENLDDEVEDVLNSVVKKTEVAMKDLDQCVEQVEKNIFAQKDVLVQSYNQCNNL